MNQSTSVLCVVEEVTVPNLAAYARMRRWLDLNYRVGQHCEPTVTGVDGPSVAVVREVPQES